MSIMYALYSLSITLFGSKLSAYHKIPEDGSPGKKIAMRWDPYQYNNGSPYPDGVIIKLAQDLCTKHAPI